MATAEPQRDNVQPFHQIFLSWIEFNCVARDERFVAARRGAGSRERGGLHVLHHMHGVIVRASKKWPDGKLETKHAEKDQKPTPERRGTDALTNRLTEPHAQQRRHHCERGSRDALKVKSSAPC